MYIYIYIHIYIYDVACALGKALLQHISNTLATH